MRAIAAAVLVVGAIAAGYWATAGRPVPPAPVPEPVIAEALLPAELNDRWRVAGVREADIELGRDRAPRRVSAAVDGAAAPTAGARDSSTTAAAAPGPMTAAEPPATEGVSGAMADPAPGAVPADAPVYSRRSAGVAPPRLTYPRMPTSAFPAVDDAIDGQYLEVLVDQSGTVETVRLRGRPGSREQSYHYGMIMAAAKAWQFEPALLDGQPVRYVTRVVLAP